MMKKLEKFPVVSKNGIEYLAELDAYEDILNNKTLRVRLYVKDKYKLLWMERERFTEIKTSYYDNEGSHEYVKAVKQTVENFERDTKENAERKKKLIEAQEKGTKQFKDWDGAC